MDAVEIGSSSKEKDVSGKDDDCIEKYYNRFKSHEYTVKGSKGEFMCHFCASKEEADYRYSALLQHSIIMVAGSLNPVQRAKHYAMARYLAFDLAVEMKESHTPTTRKRSRPSAATPKNTAAIRRSASTPARKRQPNGNVQKLAMAEKREREALEKVRELESSLEDKDRELESRLLELCMLESSLLNKNKELNNLTTKHLLSLEDKNKALNNLTTKHLLSLEDKNKELNNLIIKHLLSNDELQAVRSELLKGLADIQEGMPYEGGIGVKSLGELDRDVFTTELHGKFPQEEIEVKSVELCSNWQEKMKDPHWHPFKIIKNEMKGIHERVVKDDDISLLALKEEYGQGVCDAVVKAMTELVENNASGCYAVRELWNFDEGRKAAPDEVIHHVFELLAAAEGEKPKPRAQQSNAKC